MDVERSNISFVNYNKKAVNLKWQTVTSILFICRDGYKLKSIFDNNFNNLSCNIQKHRCNKYYAKLLRSNL